MNCISPPQAVRQRSIACEKSLSLSSGNDTADWLVDDDTFEINSEPETRTIFTSRRNRTMQKGHSAQTSFDSIPEDSPSSARLEKGSCFQDSSWMLDIVDELYKEDTAGQSTRKILLNASEPEMPSLVPTTTTVTEKQLRNSMSTRKGTLIKRHKSSDQINLHEDKTEQGESKSKPCMKKGKSVETTKKSGNKKKKKDYWKEVKGLIQNSPLSRKRRTLPLEHFEEASKPSPCLAFDPTNDKTKAKKSPQTKSKKSSRKMAVSRTLSSESIMTDSASSAEEQDDPPMPQLVPLSSGDATLESQPKGASKAPSSNKRVAFANDGANKEALACIKEVESYQDMQLWYSRAELKQMKEAGAEGGMFGDRYKEYGAALTALYHSFQAPMQESDKKLVMRFMAMNSTARGLENQVVGRGQILSQRHRDLVLYAYRRVSAEADGIKSADAFDQIRVVSQETQFMAVQLAEFDQAQVREEIPESSETGTAAVFPLTKP